MAAAGTDFSSTYVCIIIIIINIIMQRTNG